MIEYLLWLMTIAAAVLIICGVFFIWKAQDEQWELVKNSPRFIIKPAYDLGYDIWEANISPSLAGFPPVVVYLPMFGHYETREEAERQLKHYLTN